MYFYLSSFETFATIQAFPHQSQVFLIDRWSPTFCGGCEVIDNNHTGSYLNQRRIGNDCIEKSGVKKVCGCKEIFFLWPCINHCLTRFNSPNMTTLNLDHSKFGSSIQKKY